MSSRKSKRKRVETENPGVAADETTTNAPAPKPSGYPFTDQEVLVRRLKPYTSEKKTPYWKSLKDDPLPQPFAFEYKSSGGRKKKKAGGMGEGGDENMGDQAHVVATTLSGGRKKKKAGGMG